MQKCREGGINVTSDHRISSRSFNIITYRCATTAQYSIAKKRNKFGIIMCVNDVFRAGLLAEALMLQKLSSNTWIAFPLMSCCHLSFDCTLRLQSLNQCREGLILTYLRKLLRIDQAHVFFLSHRLSPSPKTVRDTKISWFVSYKTSYCNY